MASREVSFRVAESVQEARRTRFGVITPDSAREAVTEALSARNEALGPFVPEPPVGHLLWLCVDLDGTLAEPVWTPENPTTDIGDPIWRNVAKLEEAVAVGYKVVIHTSRPDTDYQNIEKWLNHWQIPWKAIRTGKPLAALYIDDRGRFSEDESWIPPKGPVKEH
jgi:hypothetical protein